MFPVLSLALLAPSAEPPLVLDQAPNTWVKRSPLAGGPASPGLAYECSLVWDPKNRRVIRWAGHNQGGGGEQNAETWTFDPLTAKWELKEPNTSPPGACCKNQILFDTQFGDDRHTWAFDLRKNEWTDLKPKAMPPTDRNDPVLAYDPHSKRVIALVRVIDKEAGKEVSAGHVETWAFDFAVN